MPIIVIFLFHLESATVKTKKVKESDMNCNTLCLHSVRATSCRRQDAKFKRGFNKLGLFTQDIIQMYHKMQQQLHSWLNAFHFEIMHNEYILPSSYLISKLRPVSFLTFCIKRKHANST